jgi:hypothetical protein
VVDGVPVFDVEYLGQQIERCPSRVPPSRCPQPATSRTRATNPETIHLRSTRRSLTASESRSDWKGQSKKPGSLCGVAWTSPECPRDTFRRRGSCPARCFHFRSGPRWKLSERSENTSGARTRAFSEPTANKNKNKSRSPSQSPSHPDACPHPLLPLLPQTSSLSRSSTWWGGTARARRCCPPW